MTRSNDGKMESVVFDLNQDGWFEIAYLDLDLNGTFETYQHVPRPVASSSNRQVQLMDDLFQRYSGNSYAEVSSDPNLAARVGGEAIGGERGTNTARAFTCIPRLYSDGRYYC